MDQTTTIGLFVLGGVAAVFVLIAVMSSRERARLEALPPAGSGKKTPYIPVALSPPPPATPAAATKV
jgi:hypothetical protein